MVAFVVTVSKFTKLRISNHRLEVEVGRYSSTTNQLRLCKTCDLDSVEDEFLFVCVCTAYSDFRKQFFLAHLIFSSPETKAHR